MEEEGQGSWSHFGKDEFDAQVDVLRSLEAQTWNPEEWS